MAGNSFLWLLPVEAELEITVIVIHLGSKPGAIYCPSLGSCPLPQMPQQFVNTDKEGRMKL